MAIHGIEFIQEMIQLNQQAPSMDSMYIDRYVQLVSDPLFGREFFVASPAQFGLDLEKAYVSFLALFVWSYLFQLTYLMILLSAHIYYNLLKVILFKPSLLTLLF